MADIIRFAEKIKLSGFMEESDARILLQYAQLQIEYLELVDEVRSSPTPVPSELEEKQLTMMRQKLTELENKLNS